MLLASRLVLIYGASCWAVLALTIPLLGPPASLMRGGLAGWLQATLIVIVILALPVILGTAAGLHSIFLVYGSNDTSKSSLSLAACFYPGFQSTAVMWSSNHCSTS